MPELPEVETMRRGIMAAVGSGITAAEALPCPRKPILIQPRPAEFSRRVAGQKITAIDRLGKRVVVRLSSGDAIIFEPRMTGLVLVADPPSPEHLRFRLRLSNKRLPEIFYWDRRGLGSVRLMTADEFAAAFEQGKLGPDALSLSADELRGRFHRSRRAIKVALLDQRAVAGIGNLYASEILHLARVRPTRRCDRLKLVEWRAIHAAMLEVLHNAIRHEGSTLSDGTYRNALNKAGGYQNLHRVYDREGQPCPRCGNATQIRRVVQAQRSTFYCAKCQT